MKAKAVLFTGVDCVEVGHVEIPEPGPGEVLVQTAYSCISPGTEMRNLAGKQFGAPFPNIPGYSEAGVVVQAGANTTVKEGTPVFAKGTIRANVPLAWGGHVAYTLQYEGGLFPLPPSIALLDASIIKLAAIAYHGVRLSRPQPHEKVVVVGLGPIGQFSARLHTLTGAHVVAFDTLPQRVKLAQRVGVEAICVEGDLLQVCRSVFPKGADVVVDATGVSGVLPNLMGAAADKPWDDSLTPGARYVIQGSYPDNFTVPYEGSFMKEVQILIPRDDQPRDTRAVIDLITRGLLTVGDLISETPRPEEAPRVYADLQMRRSDLMTAAFAWN